MGTGTAQSSPGISDECVVIDSHRTFVTGGIERLPRKTGDKTAIESEESISMIDVSLRQVRSQSEYY
jgi:hypothetical protein